MKNILVALDFSVDANLLFEYAVKLALQFSAKIWLLHVAAPDPDFVSYKAGPQSERDLRAKKLKQAHKLLARKANQLKDLGVETEGLLIQGATVKTLIEESKKLHIDLIMTGYHKHGFLYNAFWGSTSKKLITESGLPILVVPARNNESTI